MMFTTQAHRYIYNATDDGFEACAETLRFCNAIAGGKPVNNNADAELIASAVEYGERLKNQERSTRSTLLLWQVFCQCIQRQSIAYHEKLVYELDTTLDSKRIERYYDEMKDILGGESELIAFHDCLRNAFFPITFSKRIPNQP